MKTITKHPQLVTNESKVRLIAFFVFLLCCIYAYSLLLFLPLLLIIDFGLRSFNLVKFSLLGIIAGWLVTGLKLPVKPVFLPPKRFAARIGLGFSLAIFVVHVAGFNTFILTGVLICFAALESFAGFCAGCYVFDFIQRFKRVQTLF